jgi:DNA processing protein
MRPGVISRAEKLASIRLASCENVGSATFRHLLDRFGSATAALEALPEMSRRGGLQRPLRVYSEAAAEADMERAAEAGAQFILWNEAGYPRLLREVELPPPFLTVKGRLELGQKDCLAIVGARNASALGRRFARSLAAELGSESFIIASGLARGIDTAAHEGAIESGTIAVLAGGIDIVYPPENESLQEKIGEDGLLVSEMLPGTLPKGPHFPRRNRIISGCSLGVVVVEAALRSGSLITARLAGEQGRDVFAVPGSPLDPRSEGTNRLIRDGAILVTSAADILQAYGNISAIRGAPPQLEATLGFPLTAEASEPERERIASLLGPAPVDVDTLIRESRAEPSVVVMVLLELELAGQIARHPGQRVSLV